MIPLCDCHCSDSTKKGKKQQSQPNSITQEQRKLHKYFETQNSLVLDSCLCLGEATFLTLPETIRTHTVIITLWFLPLQRARKNKFILWRLHDLWLMLTAQPAALAVTAFWACSIKCKVKKISVIQVHSAVVTWIGSQKQPKMDRLDSDWPWTLYVVAWFREEQQKHHRR